jgi:hypothetical protein
MQQDELQGGKLLIGFRTQLTIQADENIDDTIPCGNLSIMEGSKVELLPESSIFVQAGENQHTDFSGGSIRMSNNAMLTMQNHSHITIQPDVNKTFGNGIFFMADGSSLIDENSACAINGDIVIEKNFTAYNSELFSQPLEELETSVFSTFGINSFNPALSDWESYMQANFSVMTGYYLQSPENANMLLEGIPNTSVQNIYTTQDELFLTGNPYTSAIAWDSIADWQKDHLQNAVYLWNGFNYSTYVGKTNNSVGIGVNNASGLIMPMQGYFVLSNSNGILELNEFSQVHHPHFPFTGNTVLPENAIRLSAVNGNFTDETLIRFVSQSSETIDSDYDAEKIRTPDVDNIQLYSITEENSDFLSINSLPFLPDGENVIKLGFIARDFGNYSIMPESINFDPSTTIYLRDNIVNEMFNLRNEGAIYEFASNVGSFNDRFEIHFNPILADVSKNENTGNADIYSFQNNVCIRFSSELQNQETSISIYNSLGTLVHSEQISAPPMYIINSALISGIYYVKVRNSKQVFSKSVYLWR